MNDIALLILSTNTKKKKRPSIKAVKQGVNKGITVARPFNLPELNPMWKGLR
jgi:hypothetical protein